MRLRLTLALLAVVFTLFATAPARSGHSGDPDVRYYLSLGDSLAAGSQPTGLVTNQGYADQLAALLRAKNPKLRLVKLGCFDETTTTMRTGGNTNCSYAQGSQLN